MMGGGRLMRRILQRAGRIRTLAAGFAGGGVRLLYPPVCMACKAATDSSDTLCSACWGAMRFIAQPLCDRLGTPFPVDYGGPLLSPAAIADPPVFARARAVALYEGPARELVHRLKFNDRLELAKGMGRLMAVAGQQLIADCALVVPVPLHWTRAWSRRCNQATELARVIAGHGGVQLAPGLIRRVRRTHTQVGLTRAQRRDNLQGAFRLGSEAALALSGRRVLLVDDVLTTGATCNAAARVLLRGGATAVDVLTFARVAADG
jgi:ComF family protein